MDGWFLYVDHNDWEHFKTPWKLRNYSLEATDGAGLGIFLDA